MDFLARCDAKFRELLKAQDLDFKEMPAFNNSKIFMMGEDDEFMESIGDIRPSLRADWQLGVPMPYDDISCVSIVRKGLGVGKVNEDLLAMYRREYGAEWVQRMSDGGPQWTLDRVIRITPSLDSKLGRILADPGKWNLPSDAYRVKSWFYMLRIQHVEGRDAVQGWRFGFADFDGERCGGVIPISEAGMKMLNLRNGHDLRVWMIDRIGECGVILEQISAISHPMNYVVKVTPELTPHESRRVSSGKVRPAQKMVHFIVVDHEVLVGMRNKSSETHSSPVPHERRGHWRRLAECCRHARLLGQERTWVRPAWVGNREFRDHKHHYEVLLDFRPQEAAWKLT